jgi:hypothetical protein
MLNALQHNNTSAYICILHLIGAFVKVRLNKGIQRQIVNYPGIKNKARPMYETYKHHSPVTVPAK